MQNLTVKDLGPIKKADIDFGDLTILVGPQASGKSILLQLIKALLDKKHIRRTLEQYGFIWGNNTDEILNRYFGEGMSGIWSSKTEVTFDQKPYKVDFLLRKQRESIKDAEEHLFYIPAQRIVCLQNGWPRFFTEYEDSVPYVLRHFSETLRQLLESGLSSKNNIIFPQQRLKGLLRESFDGSIFHGGKIVVDQTGKKRFKLELGKSSSIPFLAWSAGQKEFMPLLLSFYWLCPPGGATQKGSIRYVVLEEPEMGLHPQAIKSVILQVMDLMNRGYKVIISTHSPVLLEFAWAFQRLKENKADYKSLAQLFDINYVNLPEKKMLTNVLTKIIKTYSFERKNKAVSVKDISSLDPGSEDNAIAQWGGLSSFSLKASDIILNVAANDE